MVDLSVEIEIVAELRGINSRMDEHERRHDRDHQAQYRRQESCSKKFESLFKAVGNSEAADAEHKARLNGFAKSQDDQDAEIKALRSLINKWFGGLIFALVLVALAIYFS